MAGTLSPLQSFSTWVLPWFALIFQMPLGADDSFDNLLSIVLAIGSPALAAYSLSITSLNSRWLIREFSDRVSFPNDKHVPVVLGALQHIPIKLSESGALLPSLIILPQNDQWWSYMSKMAKKTRAWSMPAAVNVVWVMVAFIMTIIDSLSGLDKEMIPADSGFAVGACWVFLLPLVVGWLHVGSQPEANHLRKALREASRTAWVATSSEPALVAHSYGSSRHGIEYSRHPIRRVQNDEKRSAPIFNYARAFFWSQNAQRILEMYENASAKAGQNCPASGDAWVINDRGLDSENRIGVDTRVIRYCSQPDYVQLSDTVTTEKKPDIDLEENTIEAPSQSVETDAVTLVWPPHVFQRVCFALFLALGLQWGTTGAAIVIYMQTPPRGYGCRSLTFIMYGAHGSLVLFFMVLSSFFSHTARPRPSTHTTTVSQDVQGMLALFFRCSGKVLGLINFCLILVASIMQFSGIYDNCYCSSGLGRKYAFLHLMDAATIRGSTVYQFWIGGVVMSFASAILYMCSIYVSSPASI